MLDRLKREKKTRRAIWLARGSHRAVWLARGNTPLRALGALDQGVLRILRTKGHTTPAEKTMQAFGFVGEYGAVWFALSAAGFAADGDRRTRWFAAMGVAPTAIVLNYAVKKAVGRQRPVITEHPPLAKAPSKLSFPSAHATSSLAAATAIGRVQPKAKVPAHLLAAVICIGRPYLGMHYPSDVLAGAVLGKALGHAVPWLDEPRVNPDLPELGRDDAGAQTGRNS